MSKYSELIKNFNKTRKYVRDFFIYGFKSREEFDNKSARTYDNERRRVESWLAKYIKSEYASNGKNVSIQIDSTSVSLNPLYRVWKSKSFTNNDIMLHFFILDLLGGREDAKTVEDITNDTLTLYGVLFEPQTVRLKLNQYKKEGILLAYKDKKKVYYYKSESLDVFGKDAKYIINAVKFFTNALPFGIVGSTILDNQGKENDIFRNKHAFFVHTLEDEILLKLLKAINMHCIISIENQSAVNKKNKVVVFNGIPLKILTSTRSGRRYVCIANIKKKRYGCYRLDYIQKVTFGDVVEDYDIYLKKFDKNIKKAWGVSFGESRVCDKIKMTIRADEKREMFIIQRLEREGKNGTITHKRENTFVYENEVYDASEMVTWIRTFIGRIEKLESNNEKIIQRYESDIQRLYDMYNIGE